MKILLDENLPTDFRLLVLGHDVFTVAFMGWKGVSNGQLLRRAGEAGFDVMITKDTGIEFQHATESLPLSVVILRARTNAIDDLRPLVPELLSRLEHLEPRSLLVIG
jgi:predicted nuclease of predicted toxin-antitoxin system